MIYSYHPAYYKHFVRIASKYPNDPKAKQILDFNFYSRRDNPLWWVSRFMHNQVPVDRTGRFNILKVDTWPLPKLDELFSKTFDQVCYDTAKNYWNNYDDISVLWSGGLDSTCVAIAFIETKPADKKLSLVCTQESIDEYPSFYEQHKNFITLDSTDEFWKRFTHHQKNTKYVSGDIGDQIFGGVIDEYADHKDEPWQNFIEWKDVFETSAFQADNLAREWFKTEKEMLIRKFTKFNNKAPFPIVTIFDFVWWLTFTTRFNGAANNITNLVNAVHKLDKAAIGVVSCFFHNDDFEQWSIKNHHLKFPDGPETYKQPIKDFIANYNGDVDFLRNKRKEKSTPRLLPTTREEDWFKQWRLNDYSNYYLIMSDGTIYNSQKDIPFELMVDSLTFIK
jgi:hypothetical protein